MRASGLCPMVRTAGDGKDPLSVLSTNDGGSRSGSEPFHSRLPLRSLRSLWWKIRKLLAKLGARHLPKICVKNQNEKVNVGAS